MDTAKDCRVAVCEKTALPSLIPNWGPSSQPKSALRRFMSSALPLENPTASGWRLMACSSVCDS